MASSTTKTTSGKPSTPGPVRAVRTGGGGPRGDRDDDEADAQSSAAQGEGRDVPPEIESKYQALGGRQGVLGSPLKPAKQVEGGWVRTFTNGAIYYWTAFGEWAGGTFEVHDEHYRHYNRVGEFRSSLGWPIADQESLGGDASIARFQGGALLSSKPKVYQLLNKIYYAWNSHRSLGLPTGEEETVSNYLWQPFERGRIYVRDGRETLVLEGPVCKRYLREGGHQGRLGLPLGGGASRPSREPADFIKVFQHGSVALRDRDGDETRLIEADFADVLYKANPHTLGWPTDEQHVDLKLGGQIQHFENGAIFKERDGEAELLGPTTLNVTITQFKCARDAESGSAEWRMDVWVDDVEVVHNWRRDVSDEDKPQVINRSIRVKKNPGEPLTLRIKIQEKDSEWYVFADRTTSLPWSDRWGLRISDKRINLVHDGTWEGRVEVFYDVREV